jgi:hypothetical protein
MVTLLAMQNADLEMCVPQLLERLMLLIMKSILISSFVSSASLGGGSSGRAEQ